MSSVKVKSVVLAVGVAGIAATGAWLGAGLKDGSQKRKVFANSSKDFLHVLWKALDVSTKIKIMS